MMTNQEIFNVLSDRVIPINKEQYSWLFNSSIDEISAGSDEPSKSVFYVDSGIEGIVDALIDEFGNTISLYNVDSMVSEVYSFKGYYIAVYSYQ